MNTSPVSRIAPKRRQQGATLVVVLILLLAFQKQIVRGLTAGAVKG